MKKALLLIAAALLMLGAGCSPQKQGSQPEAARSAAGKAAAAQPAHTGRVDVLDAQGRGVFSLEPEGEGYSVHQASGELVAKIQVRTGDIKVEDASGKTLLRIKRKEGKGKAEDRKGAALFSIKRQSSKVRDYKLEDANGETLFKFKREAWGYKVSDGEHDTLYKLRIASLRFSAGRVVAEGAEGQAVGEVRGTRDALAAAALVLEKFDLPRRAALFIYLASFEAEEH
jgi:hypothetical protein